MADPEQIYERNYENFLEESTYHLHVSQPTSRGISGSCLGKRGSVRDLGLCNPSFLTPRPMRFQLTSVFLFIFLVHAPLQMALCRGRWKGHDLAT